VILPAKPLLRGNGRDTRRRAQSISTLEQRIREQEMTIQRLSGEVQKAGEAQALERVHQLSWQLAQAQAGLEALMEEWEKVAA
jgi:hypothetical protein